MKVIKSAFEAEFPKLLKIILNFWEKVSQNNEGYQLMFFGKLKNSNVLEMFDLDLKNENSNSDYNAEEELRKSISSFQMAFISSNLNNLSSPIQSAFLSSGTVQSKARYAYAHSRENIVEKNTPTQILGMRGWIY